jgi:hypothetical protein
VQRFTPTLAIELDSTSNMETIVPFLQPVRAELIKDATVPALPVARGLHPLTTAERSILTTDVTIDGGVKLTNVTVFATDSYPTVSDAVRDSHHAAPCNLQSGFDMLASTAPSVSACYASALEFLNIPSGEGGGLLCTIASA